MKVAIRNYRSIQRADLDINGITLLCGENAAGKSSALAALAAIYTGRMLPDDVTKGKAACLVTDGKTEGYVKLDAESGTRTGSWPGCEVETSGRPPVASSIATGLISVATMGKADRATTMIEALKALPSSAELTDAILAEEGGTKEIAAEIISRIEAVGWDGAHKRAAERGVKLKGMWQEITGAKYGSKIAEGWKPKDWDIELDDVEPGEVADQIEKIKGAIETAVGTKAVTDEERRHRTEIAERAAEIQAATDAAHADCEAKDIAITAIEKEIASMPRESQGSHPCPHCSKPLAIRRDEKNVEHIVKAMEDTRSDAVLRTARMAVAGAEGRLSRAKGDAGTALRHLAEMQAKNREAGACVAWVRDNPPVEQSAELDRLRSRLAQADVALAMITTRRLAAARHREIALNQAIIDLLAPMGMRQKKLDDVIGAFNGGRLAPLCDSAGWDPVTLHLADELTFSYGGRPYPLCSASEQWRVRLVLQIAIAQIDGSEIVLIDAADILSQGNRNGLIGLLSELSIPAVVGMTTELMRKDGSFVPPDLAKHKMGRTYWIADGIATPLDETRQRQAA